MWKTHFARTLETSVVGHCCSAKGFTVALYYWLPTTICYSGFSSNVKGLTASCTRFLTLGPESAVRRKGVN